MTDLEVRVHDAIGALAESEPVVTPPLGAVFDRANRVGKPRRSRAAVVAVAVLGSVLVAAAGGAAGKLPGSIERAFHRISSWSESCRVDQGSAQLVASVRRADGRTVEWWRAAGARAIGDEFRIVAPDGTAHDMAQSCTVDRFPPGRLFIGGASDGDAADDVSWGEAPEGTIVVRAIYRDGATADVPLQHLRYFMANLDRAAGPHDGPVRLEALGPGGRVIDSVREP